MQYKIIDRLEDHKDLFLEYYYRFKDLWCIYLYDNCNYLYYSVIGKVKYYCNLII
jgi:hypothetical protein